MEFSKITSKPLNAFNSLFYRNLEQNIIREKPLFGTTQTYPDDLILSIDYELNSHGYRSKEFGTNEEVMVLGCSQTYGRGIPEEFTWGSVFAKKINKHYIKLAQEGDSAQAQVYKAFKYFQEFGNPKIIVASFPSTRIEMPYVSKKFGKTINLDQTNITERDKIQQVFLYDELDKYSKIPYNPEKVLPQEFAIFYNFMFVQMLEQYCESNKIMLIWNMWDDYLFLDYLRINLPEILNNYLYFDFGSFLFDDKEGIEYCVVDKKELIIPKCHENLKDNLLFYRAADYNPGVINGHWGIHINQHIAEEFYGEYIKRVNGTMNYDH